MPIAVTIDFECWPQVLWRRAAGQELSVGGAGLARQTDHMLDWLAGHEVRATVFVLGMTARAWPNLVRRIASAGHEIAAHGDRHERVYHQSATRFREDTQRARDLLADLLGVRPSGYRAAEFSVTRDRRATVYETLVELGFTYDASVFPIAHRRYGIADAARGPEVVAHGRLVSLPAATVALGAVRLPVAGGGYFRVTPAPLLCAAVQRLDAEGLPAVLYFHPYEFDDRGPQLDLPTPLRRVWPRWHQVAQSLGRARVLPRLAAVLRLGLPRSTLGELAQATIERLKP